MIVRPLTFPQQQINQSSDNSKKKSQYLYAGESEVKDPHWLIFFIPKQTK